MDETEVQVCQIDLLHFFIHLIYFKYKKIRLVHVTSTGGDNMKLITLMLILILLLIII